MILAGKNYFNRALVFLILSFCLIVFFSPSAHSRTVVTKTGTCSFLVTLKIEVWGENATQAVVDQWKKNIEGQWNGPTQDSIEALALAEGIIDPIDGNATQAKQNAAETANNGKLRANRDKLNKKYDDMMKDMGLDGSSTQVGCCTITFVVDIKLRGDKAGEGYHQIEAVPSYEEVEVDGETVRKKRRSFVNMELVDGEWAINGQKNSTSGRWRSDDPDWPAEAHESGHLMGLDDQYHDDAPDEQGHEADIMANNLSWPHEEGLAELIGISGFSCNEEICCPTDAQMNVFFENYGLTSGVAGTAIAACNTDVMAQTLQDLQDQMRNMALSRMPMTKKIELHDLIQSKIDQLKKGIIDCGDPKRPMTGIGTSYGFGLGDFGLGGKYDLGGLGYELGSDSTEFCTYGGGTETTPIDPPTITFIDPDDPGTTTPEDTPGSTPGTTPGTTNPPEDTPGTTPGSTPDGTPEIFQDGFESGDITRWSYCGSTVPTDIPEGTPTETPTETPEETTTDTPAETPDETRETTVPQITYHIKAKDSVLQSDGTKLSQNLGGQRIKLIDPSLTKPQLAMGDDNKIDDGFDAGPNQCTTNDTGDCDIKISLADLIKNAGDGLTPTPARAGTPTETDVIVEIEVTGNKINSQNMIVPNDEVDALPQEVVDGASSKLTIGANTYLTYNSGYSLGVGYKYGDELKLGFNLDYEIEENICGDEQPGPPMGTFFDKIGAAIGNDIPNAMIFLPKSEMMEGIQ